MKNHSRLFRGSRRLIESCFLGLFLVVPALAEPGAPIQVTSNASLTLPAGWKVTSQTPDTPEQPGKNSGTDPQSVTLLLTAAPADAARGISLSLFHTRFFRWGPPADAGEMGVQAETEIVLHEVLSLGFAPTAIRSSRVVSSQNTSLLTVEVSAKNAAGEERVFTDTSALGQHSSSIRLCASYPASDSVGVREIYAIIQSLNIRDAGQAGNANVPPANPPTGPVTPKPAAVPGLTSPQVAPVTPAATVSDANVSAQTSQLVNDYRGALILVEGKKGVGSGFLCNMGGHIYAITNAHVLSDNIGVKLTGLDGTVFTAGASAVAVGHDIVKLEVASQKKTFEVMTNLDSNAKIGDAVMIPGNAGGASVVKPVEGKIVGIGPNLIEVDAPFVKGNSGSPIIHVATGKVLGVATYLIQRKVNPEGQSGQNGQNGQGEQSWQQPVTMEIRRFGYRLDSVQQWEPINWQSFFAQSAQVAQIEELSQDFIKMFQDLDKTHHFHPENYSSPVIQRPIRSFLDGVDRGGRTLSMADRRELVRRVIADIRSITRTDILAFNTRAAYDYFRREVEEQGRFRDELYNGLTHDLENQ